MITISCNIIYYTLLDYTAEVAGHVRELRAEEFGPAPRPSPPPPGTSSERDNWGRHSWGHCRVSCVLTEGLSG